MRRNAESDLATGLGVMGEAAARAPVGGVKIVVSLTNVGEREDVLAVGAVVEGAASSETPGGLFSTTEALSGGVSPEMVHFDAREVITFAVKTWNQHTAQEVRLAMESPAAAEVLAEDIGDACEVHDVWIEQPTVGDDARFAGVGRSARRAAATEGSKEAPLATLGAGVGERVGAKAGACGGGGGGDGGGGGGGGRSEGTRDDGKGTSRSACRSSGWSERAPRGMTSARRDSDEPVVRKRTDCFSSGVVRFVSARHRVEKPRNDRLETREPRFGPGPTVDRFSRRLAASDSHDAVVRRCERFSRDAVASSGAPAGRRWWRHNVGRASVHSFGARARPSRPLVLSPWRLSASACARWSSSPSDSGRLWRRSRSAFARRGRTTPRSSPRRGSRCRARTSARDRRERARTRSRRRWRAAPVPRGSSPPPSARPRYRPRCSSPPGRAPRRRPRVSPRAPRRRRRRRRPRHVACPRQVRASSASASTSSCASRASEACPCRSGPSFATAPSSPRRQPRVANLPTIPTRTRAPRARRRRRRRRPRRRATRPRGVRPTSRRETRRLGRVIRGVQSPARRRIVDSARTMRRVGTPTDHAQGVRHTLARIPRRARVVAPGVHHGVRALGGAPSSSPPRSPPPRTAGAAARTALDELVSRFAHVLNDRRVQLAALGTIWSLTGYAGRTLRRSRSRRRFSRADRTRPERMTDSARGRRREEVSSSPNSRRVPRGTTGTRRRRRCGVRPSGETRFLGSETTSVRIRRRRDLRNRVASPRVTRGSRVTRTPSRTRERGRDGGRRPARRATGRTT